MPETGQLITHYRIVEKIGHGARAKCVGRSVPVKYSLNKVGGM